MALLLRNRGWVWRQCMPGCLPLIAAILMQKFPGSVKLTCPEIQCHIRRRLENWKHEDLAYQGKAWTSFFHSQHTELGPS